MLAPSLLLFVAALVGAAPAVAQTPGSTVQIHDFSYGRQDEITGGSKVNVSRVDFRINNGTHDIDCAARDISFPIIDEEVVCGEGPYGFSLHSRGDSWRPADLELRIYKAGCGYCASSH